MPWAPFSDYFPWDGMRCDDGEPALTIDGVDDPERTSQEKMLFDGDCLTLSPGAWVPFERKLQRILKMPPREIKMSGWTYRDVNVTLPVRGVLSAYLQVANHMSHNYAFQVDPGSTSSSKNRRSLQVGTGQGDDGDGGNSDYAGGGTGSSSESDEASSGGSPAKEDPPPIRGVVFLEGVELLDVHLHVQQSSKYTKLKALSVEASRLRCPQWVNKKLCADVYAKLMRSAISLIDMRNGDGDEFTLQGCVIFGKGSSAWRPVWAADGTSYRDNLVVGGGGVWPCYEGKTAKSLYGNVAAGCGIAFENVPSKHGQNVAHNNRRGVDIDGTTALLANFTLWRSSEFAYVAFFCLVPCFWTVYGPD